MMTPLNLVPWMWIMKQADPCHHIFFRCNSCLPDCPVEAQFFMAREPATHVLGFGSQVVAIMVKTAGVAMRVHREKSNSEKRRKKGEVKLRANGTHMCTTWCVNLSKTTRLSLRANQQSVQVRHWRPMHLPALVLTTPCLCRTGQHHLSRIQAPCVLPPL
mmetsp:Transcript_101174/g.200971  ORF Transcript_101174/g.200971 Transcript_101174/m.200971 type:complete len:160 (-) Transcript_101174:124-603(-)